MLERHAARAATEPTPSLQHDGQRRHAAEGHDSQQPRVRHHVRTKASPRGGDDKKSLPELGFELYP
jgi:hypothetical protein